MCPVMSFKIVDKIVISGQTLPRSSNRDQAPTKQYSDPDHVVL